MQRLQAKLMDMALLMIPYLMLRLNPEDVRWLIPGLLLIFALFATQCYLLAKDGQTIGKRVCGLRIVKASTGENGGIVTNVLLRAVVASIPNLIPLYWIVDVTFIFRQDRRCLHDLIAGTRVVAGSPAANTAA